MAVTKETIEIVAKTLTTLQDHIEGWAWTEFKNETEVSNILRLYGRVYNELEENIKFLHVVCNKLESSEKGTSERLTEIFDRIAERANAANGYADEELEEIEDMVEDTEFRQVHTKMNQAIGGILNIVEDARKELDLEGKE